VSGPTPPGTGVIADATRAADAKSTSPVSPPSTTLMPTSTTTAPGLSMSPVRKPGLPTATTTMSALVVMAVRSRVCECAIVTVAFSRSSSRAVGLPTTFDRPMTTACRPASSMPLLARISTDACAVAGRKPS
jgi:hypothetical protein